jgi:hypothetical protein
MQSTLIASALRPGVNWAGIEYCTPVQLAAAHRSRSVFKHTVANVQLFANIADADRVYRAAVVRSAAALGSESAESFETSSTWYKHTDCHSIVKHRESGALYLWCIYNHARSEYTIDGGPAVVESVAALMTASAARRLLDPPKVIHNVANDVDHTVQVRVISLSNIQKIVVNRQVIVA